MRCLQLVLLVVLCAGCATQPVPADDATDTESDPFESFNRPSFALAEKLDTLLLRPLARGYNAVLPAPLRTGIGNVFRNLRTVDSAANGLLQGKPRRGLTDAGRFVLNTTLGFGGVFDPATAAGLEFGDEDLGQTLAVWGVTQPGYLYLPIVGPTGLRDLPSLVGRIVPVRAALGEDYNAGIIALDVVAQRAAALALTAARDASALDPYAFTRAAYAERRRYQIFDGRPPLTDAFEEFAEFDDEFAEEAAEEVVEPAELRNDE